MITTTPRHHLTIHSETNDLIDRKDLLNEALKTVKTIKKLFSKKENFLFFSELPCVKIEKNWTKRFLKKIIIKKSLYIEEHWLLWLKWKYTRKWKSWWNIKSRFYSPKLPWNPSSRNASEISWKHRQIQCIVIWKYRRLNLVKQRNRVKDYSIWLKTLILL